MPTVDFIRSQALRRGFEFEQLPEDIRVRGKTAFEQWNSFFKIFRHAGPLEPQSFSQMHEERRHTLGQEAAIRLFLAMTRNECMHKTKLQITQCLLAQESFQARLNF